MNETDIIFCKQSENVFRSLLLLNLHQLQADQCSEIIQYIGTALIMAPPEI